MPQESANENSGDEVNARMSRRHVLRVAGTGTLGLGLGGVALTAVTMPGGGSPGPHVTPVPTPEGLGTVRQAPHLPPGFTKTFTSRYIDTGEVRLHAVIGGDGP